jgi:hypothetical protein
MTKKKKPKNPKGKRHYNGEWYKEERIDRDKGVVVLRDNKEPDGEIEVPITHWKPTSSGSRGKNSP